MRASLSLCVLSAVVALASCGRSGSSRPGDPSDGDSTSGDEAAVSDGTGTEDASDEEKPLALTEERLQAYMAYRTELHKALQAYMKEAVDLGKKVEGKSTDVGKTFTALAGVKSITERHERELEALRKKHGFAQAEDDRIWSAIADVVVARGFLQDMGPALEQVREMQARGGEEKKAADDLLADLKRQEETSLAEARRKYGDQAVEILSKHAAELKKLYMGAFQPADEAAASKE